MRMWIVGIGVAVIGAFGLMALGLLDAEAKVYLRYGWNPLAAITGGLMFGYGTALVGTCGIGALARLGRAAFGLRQLILGFVGID